MTTASLIQRMIEAGTPADIVADVALALAAAEAKADALAQRRQADRERKAAQRGRQRESLPVPGSPRKSRDSADPAPKIYNQTPPKSSEAIASGGEAPPADAEPGLRTTVWDAGRRLLAKAGTPDRQARSIIGKWRSKHGEAVLFEALAAAEREAASDPIAFITATLENRNGTRASSQQARQHGPGAHRPGSAPGEISPRLAAGLALREKYASMASAAGDDRHDAERGSDSGAGEPHRSAGALPL